MSPVTAPGDMLQECTRIRANVLALRIEGVPCDQIYAYLSAAEGPARVAFALQLEQLLTDWGHRRRH